MVEVTNTNNGSVEELKSSLSSYIDFKNILGEEFDEKKVEAIIEDITIFEDKSVLERRLEHIYKLNPDQIKKIKTLNYSKYGSLSRKLLTGLKTEYVNVDTGESLQYSIMDIMRNTNENLMEILYKEEYGFQKIIDENNGDEKIEPADRLEESYLSPLVKRGVLQALKIVDEIQDQILKHPIDKFFVECTREHQESKRTKSRRDKICEMYDAAKKAAQKVGDDYINNRIEECREKLLETKNGLEVINDDQLRSEKIFLYFIQLGHSVYSGEQLDLDDVLRGTGGNCDVDHIYPQSLIKDDSLENKVLVLKTENQEKTDTFPIPENVLTPKGKAYCKHLVEMGLMSKEKYKKITRRSELSEAEIFTFVNRQLTTTDQSVALVCDILKKAYCSGHEQDVIYSKARNVSDFRDKFSLYKSRLTNDVHHAQDAYLNVVVGSCFNAAYGFKGENIRRIFARSKERKGTLNTSRLFDHNIESNGKIIWNTADGKQTIAEVKAQMYHKDALITFMKTQNSGKLFDLTIYSPEDQNDLIPVKQTRIIDGKKSPSPLADTTKYGGFSSPSVSYFMLVKSLDKKKKPQITIEPVQNLIILKIGDTDFIRKYLTDKMGLDSPEILIDKLFVNTVLQNGNSRIAITGKTNDQYYYKNISQLYFPQDLTNYVKTFEKIIKINHDDKKSITDYINKNTSENPGRFVISGGGKMHTHTLVVSKNNNLKLYSFLATKMAKLKIYDNTRIQKLGKEFINPSFKEKFKELSLGDQIILLIEMLKMTRCNREMSDFSLIGEKKHCGVLTINKKIEHNMRIILQSTTGFFEKTIDPWEM